MIKCSYFITYLSCYNFFKFDGFRLLGNIFKKNTNKVNFAWCGTFNNCECWVIISLPLVPLNSLFASSLSNIPPKVLLFSECNWLNNCLCISFPFLFASSFYLGVPPSSPLFKTHHSPWTLHWGRQKKKWSNSMSKIHRKWKNPTAGLRKKQQHIHYTSVDTCSTKATAGRLWHWTHVARCSAWLAVCAITHPDCSPPP